MDFSNLEQIKQHLATLNRSGEPDMEAWFELIEFNKFSVQLCAGPSAFSVPQFCYGSLLQYQKVGVLIAEYIKGEEHQILPPTDARFKNFEWCKYFHYTDNQGKYKDSYMGMEVPLGDVCQLVREVYKTSRLKLFY